MARTPISPIDTLTGWPSALRCRTQMCTGRMTLEKPRRITVSNLRFPDYVFYNLRGDHIHQRRALA